MIGWSNSQLRFTSGIGALCCAGLLADVTQQTLPAWLAVGMVLVPLMVFVFVQPEEMPRAVVAPLQVFASLYYFVLSAALLVLFFQQEELAQGWPMYVVGLVVGAIPCVVVLGRMLSSGPRPFPDVAPVPGEHAMRMEEVSQSAVQGEREDASP